MEWYAKYPIDILGCDGHLSLGQMGGARFLIETLNQCSQKAMIH